MMMDPNAPQSPDQDAKDATAGQIRTVPGLPELPTVRLFGIDVANATLGDIVEHVIAWSGTAPARTVITANLDHVMKLRDDAAFRAAYDSADIVTADGMPFVWVSRMEGEALGERVAGSDLIVPIAIGAAKAGRRVFLFGSTEERIDGAAQVLKSAAPGLVVAGTHAPPFGFDKDPAIYADTARIIREANPDIVFVALGAPKQEIWSARMSAELDHGVFLNIGGGLDFLSGEVRRAPAFFRSTGFEWLWRAGTEPLRLGPRYAKIVWALPGLLRQHRKDRRARRNRQSA